MACIHGLDPAICHYCSRLASHRRESSDVRATVHAAVYNRLVEAAKNGRTIAYSDLPAGRGQIGDHLYRIADYEKAHGRPPLTAVVVHKQDGHPAEGFAIAMEQVGYARRPGESEDDLWKRALRDVFAYWKP